MDMQYVKLNNGIEMPQVGLGTFLIPKDKLEDTLIKAYDMGYRQFDTAWRYYNEADIARIFKKHGIKREDVFITTKVNIDAFYYGDISMEFIEFLTEEIMSVSNKLF